eukprot:gene11065-14851_t
METSANFDFKAGNLNELDALLLKAESYSSFLLQNQVRSSFNRPPLATIADGNTLQESPDSKKRKSTPISASKSNKKATTTKKTANNDKKENIESHSASKIDPLSKVDSNLFVQPHNLSGGVLLNYQLDGLQWLISLWENGLNGILADEMGLGKTIQIIALIAHLRLTNTSGPYLIVGPLATLPNWLKEFKKWLPSCPVVLYHGDKNEREDLRKQYLSGDSKNLSFPVVITSFEMAIADRSSLCRHTWQYLILDEGHRIKNRNCKLLKELKQLNSVSRLLLSGTPIQNSLEELWSLLNFCSPLIFDDLDVFKSRFDFKNIGKDTKIEDIIGTEQKDKIVSKLHEILRPFVLRRLKKDVLLAMPPKREIVVYCGMTELQQEYYQCVENDEIRDMMITVGVKNAKNISQINKIMNYRKVCNHPFLFGKLDHVNNNAQSIVSASGKFIVLDRMLTRLKKEGRKVLIFSQMTELLNIIEDYLVYKNYTFTRLDGSTKMDDRQESIEDFNSKSANNLFVFLLSTRAGGLGINLTAADTVIIFDSDWNPHQDHQAQDRCHRIGQEKSVVIYRFLTSGSVEIEMMKKQISKKKLERLTMQGGDFKKCGVKPKHGISIQRLRDLLEDDVKNLSRMEVTGSSSHISDQELSLIMDRDLIFHEINCPVNFQPVQEGEDDIIDINTANNADSHDEIAISKRIPLEGLMYDIMLPSDANNDGDFLAGMN